MSLFGTGHFKLASGRESFFKIDCDALTDEDWEAIALMASKILPPFGVVEGVPRGGLKLAEAMKRYLSTSGPVLICDDVWTTGGSMEKMRDGREAIGLVAFARGPIKPWIYAVFGTCFHLWDK